MTAPREHVRLFDSRILRFTAAAIVIVLLIRVTLQGQQITAASVEQLALRDRLSFASAERRLLIAHLAEALRTTDPAIVLTGVDAVTQSPLAFTRRGIDVIYVLSTRCGACKANLPLLESLHSEGMRVIGISADDAEGSLKAYATHHQLAFPLVATASGSYFRAVRRGLTPATVFLNDGVITDYRVGLLDSALVRETLAARNASSAAR